MRIGPLGVWELLIILVVVLLIFGPRRLPEMAAIRVMRSVRSEAMKTGPVRRGERSKQALDDTLPDAIERFREMAYFNIDRSRAQIRRNQYSTLPRRPDRILKKQI